MGRSQVPGPCVGHCHRRKGAVPIGELGGRSLGVEKDRLKRGYVENAGQFDALFSFNLRTPPSPAMTPSGKRIYTMSLSEKQPDQLVHFILYRWSAYPKDRVG